MRALRARLGVTAAVLTAAAGCASTTSTGPGATSGSGGATGSSSPAAQAVTVTLPMNGQTVHIAVGGRLTFDKFPTSLTPHSPDTAVLAEPSDLPQLITCHAGPPGTDCIRTFTYTAKGKGTVTLTGHRDQCGEARPCVPPESKDFTLTVVVG